MTEELELPFDFTRSRQDQIDAAFRKFHHRNPSIWRLFEKYSLEAADAGREYFSAKMVFERIRWFTSVETFGTADVKINNNFTACYARMFEAMHPELGRFFKNRVRRSARQKEVIPDRQEFIDEEDLGDGCCR